MTTISILSNGRSVALPTREAMTDYERSMLLLAITQCEFLAILAQKAIGSGDITDRNRITELCQGMRDQVGRYMAQDK